LCVERLFGCLVVWLFGCLVWFGLVCCLCLGEEKEKRVKRNKGEKKIRKEKMEEEEEEITNTKDTKWFHTDDLLSNLRVVQKASGLIFGVGFLGLHFGNALVAIVSQNGYEEVLEVLRSYVYQIHPIVGNNETFFSFWYSPCF